MDDESVELDAGDKNKEYEVEAIRDSEVYARELKLGHLPGLYYCNNVTFGVEVM